MMGYFLPAYLAGYSFFRLIVEFFREPDQQVGYFWGFLTLGQLFSLIMILTAGVLFFWRKRQEKSYSKIGKIKV
jgi:phosphatidylglycerol---prolipoprotein diacylglyceryl transferase